MSRTIRELYGLLGINRFAPASTTHKRTAWWNDLIVLENNDSKVRSQDAKIGTMAGTPFVRCAEVPQASTGFSPFELLYGRQPRGVLDVLRETWEEGPSGAK